MFGASSWLLAGPGTLHTAAIPPYIPTPTAGDYGSGKLHACALPATCNASPMAALSANSAISATAFMMVPTV